MPESDVEWRSSKRLKPSPPSFPPSHAAVQAHYQNAFVGKWCWAHDGQHDNGFVVLEETGHLHCNLGPCNSITYGSWKVLPDMAVELEWATSKGWVRHCLLVDDEDGRFVTSFKVVDRYFYNKREGRWRPNSSDLYTRGWRECRSE